jgi:anti-anti-sigma regulatory factor
MMEAVPPQRQSSPSLPAPAEATAPKLTIEKFADANVTCLKFSGTIDEAFEGKKVARSAEGDWLVLDLGGVKKISSFGIREWVDFIDSASKRVKSIVLIDCAPKVVDQLNMVANFAGGGKVFSFYAPFRCDYCDSEHRVLLQLDKDYESIKSMKLAERPCPSCKEGMYFDEDGSTFFSYMLGQGAIELDPHVIQFLSTKLDYRVGTIDAKLHVDKLIEGRITYMRLTGDLNNSFPRDKLAEGLEGTAIVDLGGVPRVEPAGAAEWRSFVQQVTPLVDQLYLVGVQPAFLEKLCSADDLGVKGQVVDFHLPYACGSCGTQSSHAIDVAEHHGVLKFATAPELRCPACKSAMQCQASEAAMMILPALPKPAVNKDLLRTIGMLRARKIDAKKPNTGLLSATKPAQQAPRSIGIPVLFLLVVVAVGAAGYVAYTRLHHKDAGPYSIGPLAQTSAAQRPAWIGHDLQPAMAACTTQPDKSTSCVGVSQPLASQQDAEDEASDAAYEALAADLGGSSKSWLESVAPSIVQQREQAFAAYNRDPLSTQARRDLSEGRRAVARVIKRVAPVVAGRYWEAFDGDDGRRFVAFAQVSVPAADAAKLVERTKATASALGTTVVDYYAELGWRFPKVERGAIVTKLEHGPLQDLGLGEHHVVLAIDGHDVVDAASFAKIAGEEYALLAERGGTLRLLVQTDTGDPREFSTNIPGRHVDTPTPPTGPVRPPRGGGQTGGSGGINVWDRFGGSNRGGRDDPTQ